MYVRERLVYFGETLREECAVFDVYWINVISVITAILKKRLIGKLEIDSVRFNRRFF